VVLNYCTRGMIELRVRNTRLPIFCDLLGGISDNSGNYHQIRLETGEG
jgi:hypothetical protein